MEEVLLPGSAVGCGQNVSVRDDGVEEFLEDGVRFFISSNNTTGLDVGVTTVVHTSLDALTKSDSLFGG